MNYNTKYMDQIQAMKGSLTFLDQKYIAQIIKGDKKCLQIFKATAKKTIRIRGTKEVSLNELRYVSWFNGNKIDIIPFLFANIKNIMFRVECGAAWNRAVGVDYLAEFVYDQLKNSGRKKAGIDVVKYVANNSDKYMEMMSSYDVLETLCSMRNIEYSYIEELVVAALLMQDREELLLEVALNIMYGELEFTRISRVLSGDGIIRDVYNAGERACNVGIAVDGEIYNRVGEIAKILSTDSTAILANILIQKWYCDIVDKYELGQDKSGFDYTQYVEKAFKSDKSSNLRNYVEGKIDGKELVRLRKLERKSDRTSEYQRELVADSIALSSNITYKNSADLKKLAKGVMIGFKGYRTENDVLYAVDTDMRVAWSSKRYVFLMERIFGNTKLLSASILCADDLEEQLDKAVKETAECRETVKKANSQCRSAEKKVRNLEEINKKQAEKIKKLDSLKASKSEIESLQKELLSVRAELREKENEISEVNKALETKSSNYSKLSKRQKKAVSELNVYKNILGELDIVKEDENSCTEQTGGKTLENMIEALNNFKIMFCGGIFGVEKRLAEMGLTNIDIVHDMGDTKRGQQFDLLVIFTDFVSHKLVYSMCDCASKIGAEKMYYQGTNLQKMVRSLYSIYVESSEATENE